MSIQDYVRYHEEKVKRGEPRGTLLEFLIHADFAITLENPTGSKVIVPSIVGIDKDKHL